MIKFMVFAITTLFFCNASWSASPWSPFSSAKSKVYAEKEAPQDESEEDCTNEQPISTESKKKPFMDMSWIRNIAPPKFNFKRQGDVRIVPNDGYETGSMTDEDSKHSDNDSPRPYKSIEKLEEEVIIAQKALEEARARNKMDEQMQRAQVRKQKEERAYAIASEDTARELLDHSKNAEIIANEFQNKLKDNQNSARLAQARAIKEEILAKKAKKDAIAKAKKETFEEERRAALEISDAPRIAAAEACFVNENDNACERSGCRWNSLIRVCDVDCNSFKKERSCHSAIGIRRNSTSEGKNASIVANKEYELARICSFDSRQKSCVFRAGQF